VTLIFVLLALLGFGFALSGSSSGTESGPHRYAPLLMKPPHHMRCTAHMKAESGAVENRRDCGPPVNP
jgi:hypothetical protein